MLSNNIQLWNGTESSIWPSYDDFVYNFQSRPHVNWKWKKHATTKFQHDLEIVKNNRKFLKKGWDGSCTIPILYQVVRELPDQITLQSYLPQSQFLSRWHCSHGCCSWYQISIGKSQSLMENCQRPHNLNTCHIHPCKFKRHAAISTIQRAFKFFKTRTNACFELLIRLDGLNCLPLEILIKIVHFVF